MRPATLYKGYQAKLAARETARQRMLVTAWEIEEAERFLAFLDALYIDNEERFGFAQDDLDIFRSLFSERDRSDVDDDRDYLQAVYEDELEVLRVVSLQAEQFSKILGARTKKDFLQPGSRRSGSRSPEPGVSIQGDKDDFIFTDEEEDNSHPEAVISTSSASNREFKLDRSLPHASSTPFTLWPADERHVAKPHLTHMQQLNTPLYQENLTDEQPPHFPHHPPPDFLHHDQPPHFLHHDQPPDFMHHQPPDFPHHQPPDFPHQPPDFPHHQPPNFPHHQPQDLSHHQPQDFSHHDQLQDFPHHDQLPDFMHPQQENLMGDQQNLARDQQPSPSSGYITPLYRLSWQAPNPLQHIAPSPPPLTPHLPSPEVAPMWIGDDDEFRALLAPPPDLEHLQSMSMGEIPGTHVIHTTGPTRTANRRRRATRRMPPTPRATASMSTATATTSSETTTTAVPCAEPAENSITAKTRDQAISLSKELIVSIIFSNDALASSPDDKKRIVKNMIIRVRPKIPALLVASHWTADDKDVKKIWSAVTKSRTAFATLIRQAVVMGYSLLPPQGCNIAPDTFRIDRVRCLVMDNPLAFMHQYSFAGDGTLIIHTKFNNEFIIHILTQIIWRSTFRLHTFLEGSPRRQLHYAISAVGAITESVLIEQGKPHLAKGRITPQMTFPTFAKILSNLDKLNVTEQAIVDEFKDSIVIFGHSQQHIDEELSDFDFE
ncbi:hypothetical protein BD769DRAFT_1386492 [Suillus cothurnatus]|nr:hypothetical protein BD769DRAFT_1386492 [Suillus cothurnatus]